MDNLYTSWKGASHVVSAASYQGARLAEIADALVSARQAKAGV